MMALGGRALTGRRESNFLVAKQTPNAGRCDGGTQTGRAKLVSSKGKKPRPSTKVPDTG